MAQINADPNVLERVARELDSIAADIDSQGRNLQTAGGQTAAVWKSRYTNQYLDSVDKTRKKILDTSGSVRRVANSLRLTASEIRRVEREIQQQVSRGER